MAEVVDAPPAAPAAPAAAPAATESFSSATPELKPNVAPVDKGPQPEKPKPGSAKDKMFKELRQKYGGQTEETEKKAKTDEEADTPPDTITDEKPAAADKSEEKAGVKTEDKKKVSPWKLVDEHKAARAKVEAELAEIKKTLGPPEQLKKQMEAIQAIQKRNQELEEEIKYVNYSKSKEFQEKYQQPYEESWKKWMGELGELTVTDNDTGAERPIQPNDLLELVNMPLQKARAKAQDIYGAYADDVMSARKELRGLFDSQQKALEEARKAGDGWQARMQQEFGEKRKALTKEVGETWTKAIQEVTKDERVGKYFQTVEGDEEINTRLKQGFEMADRAFTVNPFDPRLTPEQRAEVVQLHAAVRNRSAAFGRLSLENQRLEKKLAAIAAELNKYKEVEPRAAQSRETQSPSGGSNSAKDQVFGALRKLAQ